MKTKKTVIAVLTATLLVSSMLIIGCLAAQIDEINVKGDEEIIDYQVPVGKGVVRFKIADSNIRTILPDFAQYSQYGSNVGKMYFDIKFTRTDDLSNDVSYFPKEGPGTSEPLTKANYTTMTSPIPLTAGVYNYLITAYNQQNKNSGLIPIAGYTGTGLTVTDGHATSTHIDLKPLIDPDYDGILSYKITLPQGTYTTKSLKVFEYTDWKTSPSLAHDYGKNLNEDANDDAESEDTISLPGGYYIVIVTVGNQYYITRQYTEALHIYPGYTSVVYELEVPPLIQNVFAVSFDLGGKTLTNTVTPNTSTQHVDYAELAIDPGVPETDDFTFDGWRVGSTSGNRWDFSKWVVTNLSLFARWNAGFSITLLQGQEHMAAPVPSAVSLVRGNLDGDITIDIDLAAPTVGGGSWTTGSIIWSISPLVDGETVIANNHTSKLTINNGGIFKKLIANGETSITVSVHATVTVDSEEIPYSAKVVIPVTGVAVQLP